jgi:hypothetical protein
MTILLMFQKAGPDLKGPLTLFARRQEGLLCYEEPHDIRSKINSRPKTNPVKQLLGGFGIAITRRENAPGRTREVATSAGLDESTKSSGNGKLRPFVLSFAELPMERAYQWATKNPMTSEAK